MKCKTCKYGHISHSGKTLTCLSKETLLKLGNMAMILIEDINMRTINNCISYKEEKPIKPSGVDSFNVNIFEKG